MLDFKGVTKYYGKTRGVENLSFQVAPGEILGIIGENGSGKTTTFRLLLNLLEFDQGAITLNSKPIKDIKSNLFGYLPEERSLFQDLSVKRQLLFFAQLKDMTKRDAEFVIDYWLEKLKISHYENSKVKTLSKGNQQKIQLIVALLHDPLIIILDEPFTGLDGENVQIFKDILLDLQKQNKYLLISSHQYDIFEEFASKILVIKDGVKKHFDYLSALKLKQTKRAVTILDTSENYYNYQGVYEVIALGKRVRIIFENEAFALKFIRQNLSNYPLEFLKIELLPLIDLMSDL